MDSMIFICDWFISSSRRNGGEASGMEENSLRKHPAEAFQLRNVFLTIPHESR